MVPFTVRLALLALLSLVPVQAFIGMGMAMYNPPCAYACRSVIEKALIACPSAPNATASSITPACRAVAAPFLSTLAYCIKDKCYPEFSPSREKVEWYWAKEATGDEGVPAMWGWQETVDKINGTPTATFSAKVRVTEAVLVPAKEWLAVRLKMENSERQQVLYARYTLTIFLVGVGIPILLTALLYLPYIHTLSYWLKPGLIYPTLLHRHVEPVFRLFHIPTLGQTTYIVVLSVITLTLTIVDYQNLFSDRSATEADILNYLGMRTGILSMALLPLTVLFAGRNNVLLYLSNWSHSTYLLLHRWVARLCLLIIILHSIIEFVRYTLKGTYGAELALPYVQWGIVGLFACLIMIVAAQFRRYQYEIFLISHIVLAVIFIVGTWYHLELKFFRERGYQQWIYLCSAIWFFDRLVRLGRVLKTGVRKATITPVGDEVVRVDIEGVRWLDAPGQHAYLFLPAVRKWAPWENHPFSVIPTHLLSPRSTGKQEAMNEKDTPPWTPSASGSLSPPPSATPSLSSSSTSGITVYIKRNKGITSQLHAHPHPVLRALMDGPYRNTSSRPVLSTDRLILFAGGIGITGVLPFVHAHPNVKLYWSVRPSQAALVDELERTLPGHVERSILVGRRNSVEEALTAETRAGWGVVGVVVCGPGRMCDEVRNKVAELDPRPPFIVSPQAADKASIRAVLVFGSTGTQGGAVVNALIGANTTQAPSEKYLILAVTRDPTSAAAVKLFHSSPDVQLVKYDPADTLGVFAAAKEAADEVSARLYGVFSVQNAHQAGEVQQAIDIADLAVQHGYEHLIYSSVDSAGKNPTGVSMYDTKLTVEGHIRTLPPTMKWTILRPTWFMDNWIRPQLQFAMLVEFDPEAKYKVIAAEDLGRVAVLAFGNAEAYRGRAIELAGDEVTIRGAKGVLEKYAAGKVFELAEPGVLPPPAMLLFQFNATTPFLADIAKLKVREEFPFVLDFDAFIAKNRAALA